MMTVVANTYEIMSNFHLKRIKDIQTQTRWGYSNNEFGSKKHYLRDIFLRSNLKKYAYGKCSKQS